MNKNHHIFLVEDDLSFGAVLKSYLEINDYTVTWVDDGKYALDKFRLGLFDNPYVDEKDAQMMAARDDFREMGER